MCIHVHNEGNVVRYRISWEWLYTIIVIENDIYGRYWLFGWMCNVVGWLIWLRWNIRGYGFNFESMETSPLHRRRSRSRKEHIAKRETFAFLAPTVYRRFDNTPTHHCDDIKWRTVVSRFYENIFFFYFSTSTVMFLDIHRKTEIFIVANTGDNDREHCPCYLLFTIPAHTTTKIPFKAAMRL